MAIGNGQAPKSMTITDSLHDLQTDEQRRILDTVAQVRKCGLESILSLPQLVVCGDQSAGKSSVLEALTEIPFPRNDNLCTRFATEIILRRGLIDSLTIKVIPDNQRPSAEQAKIRAFEESITNFEDLPSIMSLAMEAMGMDENSVSSSTGAFARDVLSIEIEGPTRPQLTLVDIPGLIANATKGVTDADVKMVAEITDHYISQPRTICLAVISATNDHANQPILTKVRKYDPHGDRTLGIITKPDRLSSGSGSEKAFISLAQNEDVFFRLGWHVLKNRSFEEGDCSLMERNIAEDTFFRTSNFKALPKEAVGINSLRTRLSRLLFEHVKQELPKLRQDLEDALANTKAQISVLGSRRSTPGECKAYLAQLSLEIFEISKAAVDGHYEGEYFHAAISQNTFDDDDGDISASRVRAIVQKANTQFAEIFRKMAHKYHIEVNENDKDGLYPFDPSWEDECENDFGLQIGAPVEIMKEDALRWVKQALANTRGRELVGNYNPLLVGVLFWEQASKWKMAASDHIDNVALQCEHFLKVLLQDKCPKDVESKLWETAIHDALKARSTAAHEELGRIMEDVGGYPINYNHYYTETIKKRRTNRQRIALVKTAKKATKTVTFEDPSEGRQPVSTTTVDIDQIVNELSASNDQNMESFGSEEALDCLLAIYKVSQKTFIANVTTQVIERHIVRGLEKIFSPVVVNAMSDTEVEAIASEPHSAKRQREFLEDRIKKLQDGHNIFKGVMGTSRN
ncbi:dynamin family protein-like protein [Leptodontidium sp. MPI-SDFR-AT-0119]|nr:dynamin family protein-like protein [Leptodontidium sp. MPI-SDFR-AT-0119]